MNTPWGRSDSKTTYLRGVSFVSTPGHGGFAITPSAALKYLSTSAVSRALKYGSYYFFEEDCDAYLVHFEIAQTRAAGLSDETILMALSQWHADYLIERGIEPNPVGLKFFNENKQADRMRADKSPDLIVSASGDWADWVPKGRVGVITADGKRYTVRASEYAPKNLNLLSQHTDVQEAR